ncbi:MAG: LytTR family DNA-binding domain-containing protein [Melioribacteraceae bacterium]|nr:LytTR family DNA-binding domain-containing protein [Melioribacteraceae bacterium]
MINTIIIDDEKSCLEAVSIILNNNFNSIKIIGEANSVKSGIELLKKEKPELLFLDIDLGDGTGFDILRAIDCKKIKVIFITAFHEYAIKAFKFSAFDYLLKPLKASDLIATVNRVIEESLDKDYSDKFDAMLSNFSSVHPKLKKMVLKTSDKIHVVNINDIIHCKADNTYTTFFLVTGKKIVVSKPLKKYEEMLSDNGFMRVHQSHLINLNYIQHLNKQDGGILVMSDNSEIPVSYQQKQALTKYFESL